MPATTPPAMAPVFDDFLDDELEPEDDEDDGDDGEPVETVSKFCRLMTDLRPESSKVGVRGL
jgi:hypothetical protein